MQLIESHGTFKNESLSEFIRLISGALWLADDQCNGENALTDGLQFRTCRRSACPLKWNPGLPYHQAIIKVCPSDSFIT